MIDTSTLNLKPHEEAFEIKPVGIRYVCEFCNKGEMISSINVPTIINAEDQTGPILIQHFCNHCGKGMLLPRAYPRVEFVPVVEESTQKEIDIKDKNILELTNLAEAVAILLSRYSITKETLREVLYKGNDSAYDKLVYRLITYQFLIPHNGDDNRYDINHKSLHNVLVVALRTCGFDVKEISSKYITNKDFMLANAIQMVLEYEYIRTDFFKRNIYGLNDRGNNFIMGKLKSFGIIGKEASHWGYRVYLEKLNNVPEEIRQYLN